MFNAFLWGLLGTSSLVLGGIFASRFSLNKRTIGIIMGFGAGTLIAAISYELIFESIKIAPLTGFPALGFFTGAAIFYFADILLGKYYLKRARSAWHFWWRFLSQTFRNPLLVPPG